MKSPHSKTLNWFYLAFAGALLLSMALYFLPAVDSQAAGQESVDTDINGFRTIDIDVYVQSERPMKAGTTSIIEPVQVRFPARLKQYPQKREVKYLYEVMQFYPLDPQPKVSHRMFVTTAGGHILPLYVEDGLVARIQDEMKEEGAIHEFMGYHLYNYSKGPAILITDFRTSGEDVH